MIAALATECERLQILLASYSFAIKAYFTKYPEAALELRRRAEQAVRNPNIREAAAQQYAPLYRAATSGLDAVEAQKVLDNARAFAGRLREAEEEEDDILGQTVN